MRWFVFLSISFSATTCGLKGPLEHPKRETLRTGTVSIPLSALRTAAVHNTATGRV